MDFFIWSTKSSAKAAYTTQKEPIQPFLFASLLKFCGARYVFDVGANVGSYTLMSSIPNSVKSIFAFEPDDEAFAELNENIFLNGIENKVETYNSLVSNDRATLAFGICKGMSGVNSVIDTSIHSSHLYPEIKSIDSIMLDDIEIERNTTVGIKIDVEGHEENVLQGAHLLLTRHPCIIQAETFESSNVSSYLNSLGYHKIYSTGPDSFYTNIENLLDSIFLLNVVEYSNKWFVESSSNRNLAGSTIKNSLKIQYELKENKLHLSANLMGDFFSSEVEFAFYLIVDGVKVNEIWYQQSKDVVFDMPSDYGSVEMRAFVREVTYPDKKVMSKLFFDTEQLGYRPSEAMLNPVVSSSSLCYFNNSLNFTPGYPKVNLLPVISNSSTNEAESVLIFTYSSVDLLPFIDNLSDECKSNITCVCISSSPSNKLEGIRVISLSQLNGDITNIAYFFTDIAKLRKICIRSQFVEESKIQDESYIAFISLLSPNSIIYQDLFFSERYNSFIFKVKRKFEFEMIPLEPFSVISRGLRSTKQDLKSRLSFYNPYNELG